MSITLKRGTRLRGKDSSFPDLVIKGIYTQIPPNNFDNRVHYIVLYWDDDDGNRKERLYREALIIENIRDGIYTVVND